ncbi:cell division protein FtsX [Donghicola sp. C2-DW-16]|uniref:Cell division protein FtsX n=1 Tax=Donghicola mangrovi TaxID=2729614 RepID=A0ABX2PAS4_9RHOB|nr:FtsX-like permease family protein [Donghicola mangrovi]NVO26577.1 cell division protein FtsX [Donghicola mangrovi]
MNPIHYVMSILEADTQADRVVPPTGHTVRLTLFSAAAMAFLAVFAMALSMATGRLAVRWGDELARSSTIRISAPAAQEAAQTEAALRVLSTTPGIKSARALTPEEEQALLEPWFGNGVLLSALPVPQLIEVIEEGDGYDVNGLRLRLQAEVPGATLDDHSQWRKPLIRAAYSLRRLGTLSLLLIGGTMAAIITLAATAALAANGQVIRVLRLVGATDSYIASAFVRRFTLRALIGGVIGTVIGMGAVFLLPGAQAEGGFLTGLGFQGWQWLWPLIIPPMGAVVAFFATRGAAMRTLRGLR